MTDEELRKLLEEIKEEASYKGNLVTWIGIFCILLELAVLLKR